MEDQQPRMSGMLTDAVSTSATDWWAQVTGPELTQLHNQIHWQQESINKCVGMHLLELTENDSGIKRTTN